MVTLNSNTLPFLLYSVQALIIMLKIVEVFLLKDDRCLIKI